MPNTEESIQQTGGVPDVEMEVEICGMIQYPTDKSLSVEDMPADAKATGDAIASISEDLSDTMTDVSGILGWTGADIPVNGTAGADSIATIIAAIQAWTGNDIPVSNASGAQKITEAINAVYTNLYPVGSLYVTASPYVPSVLDAIGTWTEILMPMTWGDVEGGQRSYVAKDTSASGNLHFWMRTA